MSIKQIDLSTTIAGVHFKNPLIAASGTFGYGTEYAPFFDTNLLGGICSKGLTLEARSGNDGCRLQETPSGLINSIGLENPGIPHFILHELETMLSLDTVTIANLSGSAIETYVEGAKLLDTAKASNGKTIEMIELNISCPNVKAGGMAFGLDPCAASEVTAAVRAVTKKPLMVKLSPNAGDIVSIAHAVREAGADAVSLINTIQAMAIDIEKKKPVFANIKAGLSGPAVRPIALRMVWDIATSFSTLPKEKQIPIVALGGIANYRDVLEFIMAGASAVQIGTAFFANPLCAIRILEDLQEYMKSKNISSLSEIKGCAL